MLSVLLLLACNRQADPDRMSQGDRLTVELEGETFTSKSGISVNVDFPSEDSHGVLELSWGIEGKDAVSLFLRVPYPEAADGRVEVPLTSGPSSGDSVANLAVDGDVVTGGLVSLRIEGGRAEGTVQGQDVSFQGHISLGCAVLPSRLPGDGSSVVVGGDSPILVGDDDFKSLECARVRADLGAGS